MFVLLCPLLLIFNNIFICVRVKSCWVWWHTPVIPALEKLRQEDHKLEASLGYRARPCI